MSILQPHFQWLARQGISFPSSTQEEKLEQFLDLLLAWNRKISLTSDNDRQTLLKRHLLDSLIPVAAGKIGEETVVDIGSGTGFPGIPLAVMLPGTQFILIEKVARKCAFLKMVARRLQLSNIQVAETLLEDWYPKDFPPCVGITRAVRLDDNLKEQLEGKGISRLLYFSSQPGPENCFEYRLPDENRTRYLDNILFDKPKR